MTETNWVPGLVVAAIGAVGGILLAMRTRGGAPAVDPRPFVEVKRDLLARKDELLALIRELDDTRDSRDPAVYAAERAKLEAEAAETLRKLEGEAPAAGAAPPPPPPSTPPRGNPALVGALWGAMGTAVLGLVVWGLSQNAAPRNEGQSMTGGPAMGGGGRPSARASSEGAGGAGGIEFQAMPEAMTGPPSAEIAALKAAVEQKPDDLEAKNDLGHAMIAANDIMAAFRLAEEVVKKEPENPEARTHQGVVLMSIGDMQMAGKLFDKVLAKEPAFSEALGYRGAVSWQTGDTEGAIATWEKAKTLVPTDAATFDKLIAMAKAGPPPSASAAPHGAAGGGMAGASGAAAGPAEVGGEVRLGDGLDAKGTLFIYVRADGVDSGPPVRVKRMPASFPAKFSISAADSPMGGTLPDKIQVVARLDPDGNPSTKEPEAPTAKLGGLATGATDLVLELKKP